MQLIHLAPVIHGSSSSAQEHAERSSGTLRRSMCLTESVVGIPSGGVVGMGCLIPWVEVSDLAESSRMQSELLHACVFP